MLNTRYSTLHISVHRQKVTKWIKAIQTIEKVMYTVVAVSNAKSISIDVYSNYVYA